MLDPSSSAALAAMGLYVYLSVAIAAMDAKDKQVFVELREPQPVMPAPAPLRPLKEEVLRVRGQAVFTEAATHTDAGGDRLDSVQVLMPVDTDWTEPVYILGWRPVVQRHRCPDGTPVDLIHHINLNAFPKRTGGWTLDELNLNGWLDDAMETRRIVATYDRGAGEYRLPQGYGIQVGPGGYNDALQLEFHLLKPECWDFAKQPATPDQSGFDVVFTRTRPPRLASLLGFTDEGLRIEPKRGKVHHITELPPDGWASIPGPLELLAVHLHSHDLTLSKQMEVQDAVGLDHWMSPLEEMPFEHRYGSTQSMKNLATLKGWPRIVLTSKTKMRMHCHYYSDQLTQPITEGTSHGQEMCSLLFVVGLPESTMPGDLGTRPRTVLSHLGGFNVDPQQPSTWGPRLLAALGAAAAALADGFRRLV